MQFEGSEVALPRPSARRKPLKTKKTAELAYAGRAFLFRAVSLDEDAVQTPIKKSESESKSKDIVALSICCLDGSIHALRCQQRSTIRAVKKQFQRQEGTPWRLLMLYVDGSEEQLKDGVTLRELGQGTTMELHLFKETNRFYRLKYVDEHSTGGVWQDTTVNLEIDCAKTCTRLPIQLVFAGSSGQMTVTLAVLGKVLKWASDSIYISAASGFNELVWYNSDQQNSSAESGSRFPWSSVKGAAGFRDFALELLGRLDLIEEEWGQLMRVLDISAHFGNLPVGIESQPPPEEAPSPKKAHAVVAPIFM
jgi:hypothetical protein